MRHLRLGVSALNYLIQPSGDLGTIGAFCKSASSILFGICKAGFLLAIEISASRHQIKGNREVGRQRDNVNVFVIIRIEDNERALLFHINFTVASEAVPGASAITFGSTPVPIKASYTAAEAAFLILQ